MHVNVTNRNKGQQLFNVCHGTALNQGLKQNIEGDLSFHKWIQCVEEPLKYGLDIK